MLDSVILVVAVLSRYWHNSNSTMCCAHSGPRSSHVYHFVCNLNVNVPVEQPSAARIVLTMLSKFCSVCKSILPHAPNEPIPSPLAQILGTNYVPSDTQCARGRHFVTEISTAIRRLDNHISRLRLYRDGMIRHRRDGPLSFWRRLHFCDECQSFITYEPNIEVVSPYSGRCLGENYQSSASEHSMGCCFVAERRSNQARRLDDQISRLCLSRDRMIRLQDEYTALLSKFRQLPAEVMGLIFTLYIDAFGRRQEVLTGKSYINYTNPSYVHNRRWAIPGTDSQMAVPLSIAAVCRHWRFIALSMSSLWTNLHLVLKHCRDWQEVASCLVERSQIQPLTVDMDMRSMYAIEEALPLAHLGMASERWRAARFLVDVAQPYTHYKLWVLMMDLLKDGLPELKFLSFGSETRPMHNSEFVLSLPDMPQLRSLELYKIRPKHVEKVIPWSQLRELILFDLHRQDIVATLDMCPNLTRLRYQSVGREFVCRQLDSIPRVVICHQRLSSLELVSTSTRVSHDLLLLDVVELPGLSTLILATPFNGVRGPNLPVVQLLISFLTRSRCELKTLCFEAIALDPRQHCNQLGQLFALIPHVESLRLQENAHVTYDGVLDLLARGGSCLLPRLRHVEYQFHVATGHEHHDIFCLAASVVGLRWEKNGGSDDLQQLKSMILSGERPPADPENSQSYRALVESCRSGFIFECYFDEHPRP